MPIEDDALTPPREFTTGEVQALIELSVLMRDEPVQLAVPYSASTAECAAMSLKDLRWANTEEYSDIKYKLFAWSFIT